MYLFQSARILVLILSYFSIYLLHTNGVASPAISASERRSAFLPSIHTNTDYDRIHFYSQPIQVTKQMKLGLTSPSKHIHTLSSLSSIPSTLPSSSSTISTVHPLVNELKQTFPHLTFLLHTKSPLTAANRQALNTYLAPYKLGRYLPHHTFLVTIGHNGTQVADEFRMEKHPSTSNPEHLPAFLNHPTSQLNASDVEHWLRRAPSVLYVTPYLPHHSIHPKLTRAIQQVQRRNRQKLTLSETTDASASTINFDEEVNWGFTDFDQSPRVDRWISSPPSHSNSTNLLLPSERSFQLVKLHVSLHSHPLLKYSHKESDSPSGTSQHASHLTTEQAAMAHSSKVLKYWLEQLSSLDLQATQIHPSDVDDAHWMRSSVHDDQGFTTSHSIYDSTNGSNHAAEIATRLVTPKHLHLTLITPTMLQVHVSHWYLQFILDFLSTRLEVAWIEPSQQFKTQNKYIHTIIQNDRGNETSIWSHDLKGANQAIQLGDTGLDTDSCFFSDPTHPIPVGTWNANHRKVISYQLFENADQGDDAEGHGTHVGGSLAGCVYGSTTPSSAAASHPLAAFNGMAPLAKIAFFDFKKSGQEELLVPLTVYKPYLLEAYTNGNVRISSNSWGSPDGEYSSYCHELDQFAHDYSDSLIVFAAGNYGETGWNTISSPGVSKNILTVGSTKTSPASFFDAGLDWGFVISSGPSELMGRGFGITEANFGVVFANLSLTNVSVVVAVPDDACSPLTNPSSDLIGSIVLVRRGTCHFGAKALAVQTAGLSQVPLVVIVNNEDGPAAHMAADSAQVGVDWRLSIVMVTKTIGESLIHAANLPPANRTAPLLISAPVKVSPPDENESVLSSFSSRGPTFGGRLKPDLLAPGEFVRSVRSDGTLTSANTCPFDLATGILQLEGTSMATPIVSGSAAMVREYLMEGFYPSGQRTATDQFTRPTSSLVKAMLIHSAISASGEVITKKQTDSIAYIEEVVAAPSNFQGFGRLLLEHVLRFQNTPENQVDTNSPLMTTSLPNIELFDSEPLIDSDQIHSYCYLVSVPPPANTSARLPFFRATLVWTDPPAAESASFVLVNNLDLFVALPSLEKAYLGNNLGFYDGVGQRHLAWDLENNVEQVSFELEDIQNYTDTTPPSSYQLPIIVHVRGTNVVEGLQHYSLVVSGWFLDSFDSTNKRLKHLPIGQCLNFSSPDDTSAMIKDHLGILCPNDCYQRQGQGNCSYQTGQCLCQSDWTGDDCSQLTLPMTYSTDFSWSVPAPPTVPSDGWVFYYFSLFDILSAFSSEPDPFSSVLDQLSGLTHLRLTMIRTSSTGDPDLFLSINGYPSLRTHDYANTNCDGCAPSTTVTDPNASPPGTSLIDVPLERLNAFIKQAQLAVGSGQPTKNDLKIRIGIHGYCCDSSTVTLTIEPIRPKPTIPIGYWLGPLLAVLFLLVVIYLLYRRRQRRIQQGLDVLPLSIHRSDDQALTSSSGRNGDIGLSSTPHTPTSSTSSASAIPPSRLSMVSLGRVRGQFMPLSKDEDEHARQGQTQLPHSAAI